MRNIWKGGANLEYLIEDIREQISDDAELYTDEFIVSAINSALKLMAKEEDLRRLFRFKLQTELASVNKDGTPAARWDLKLPGAYTGKDYFNIIREDECYECTKPCYKSPKDFFRCCTFPENVCPGDPCSYTLEHFGSITTLTFDRPPSGIYAVNASVYLIPQRITLEDETIPLGEEFTEPLKELVKIIINKEQTSFDQARMRYEDYDKVITDLAQLIALREMNDEVLIVNGALD